MSIPHDALAPNLRSHIKGGVGLRAMEMYISATLYVPICFRNDVPFSMSRTIIYHTY